MDTLAVLDGRYVLKVTPRPGGERFLYILMFHPHSIPPVFEKHLISRNPLTKKSNPRKIVQNRSIVTRLWSITTRKITWYYDISHLHIIPFPAGYRVPLLESEAVVVVADVDVAESSQR
ncbi:hypothetical protein L195_g015636 [Trifolium pratense]|uniref:Uncharacterized protein n=1 Tax=Trifolium pratense TaxID=57577 RepID=A0A2K3MNX8_TRIPR|nr:hypothetical protein L195_g015636 [Trifolium pratense]